MSAGLAPARYVKRRTGAARHAHPGVLYAFYDLTVEPITYDFLWFLCGADLTRRAKGLEQVHVVIVPGPQEGVREEDSAYETVVDRESRKWRIANVLMALTALLPACSGVTLAGSRAEAAATRNLAGSHYYPNGYESCMPVGHHPNDCLIPARKGIRPIGVLRAQRQGLQYIEQFVANYSQGRRLITITIRDYAYGQDRNSNLSAWSNFAKELDVTTWWPVFVLDTERTLDPLPEPLCGFDVMREASWNVGLRMALYERAWLNMGVNNGPMGLCWLNEQTRYLTFKMVTTSVPQATVEFNRSRGFEPNESLPFATPFQKWVWEDDTVEVIRREFEAMVAVIEAHERESVRVQPLRLED